MLNHPDKFPPKNCMKIKDEKILFAMEDILYSYEGAAATRRFCLARDEYLFLYGISKGCDLAQLMDYLNRQRSTLYSMRKKIIRKFRAETFEQVMFVFGQLNSDK